MRDIKYPLASTSWDDAEIAAMQAVIAAGMFTMGPNVAAFEEAFASQFGTRYAVMVNSGSSANLLAVAALFYRRESPLHRGDEVIVPAVSWSTTYYPLYQYGLKLKFVDIDAATLNYDLNALAEAISANTRMVVLVNLLGNPNDFAAIRNVIGGREIVVIEDNCESMGATYGGKQAGTFGALGTFSSFFSHHISTMEGGVVVTDDEELYHILLSLRAHGWTRNLPTKNRVCSNKSSNWFEESFRFVLPGYNLRPLELSGAIGVEQLKKLPEFVRIRRENAARFKSLMAEYPQFATQQEIGESSWFGFSIAVRPGAPFTRADVLQRFDECGIETRPIVTGNFTKNEVVKRWFDYSIHDTLRNADWIDSHGFFIGNHQYPLRLQFDILDEALAPFKG